MHTSQQGHVHLIIMHTSQQGHEEHDDAPSHSPVVAWIDITIALFIQIG
jgi:hypothetical protein